MTNETPPAGIPSVGRTENFYRKWRPRSFAELYGQEHVARTLTNALATGRVAHAYLLTGPRGTGKTTTGRLYAKALNCRERRDGEPCNRCESCLAYLAGRAIDLVELDAASNRGIDEIRGIRDKVAFAPGAGEYKVYLIDEVHMLTDAAFNALLKTLEEPPPHAVFMLATTEAHKVPATVLSRCQRFDFRRAPLAALVANLERICEGEGLTCEPAALELIARSATGSHRDAVNVLDQLATSYGHDLTLEHVRTGLGLIGDERSARLARLALAGDLGGGLSLIASVRDDGLDLRQFQRELVAELRALLMAKSGLPPEDGATIERQRDLQAAVSGVTTPRLLVALRAFGEADLKADPTSTLPLDIALANCILGAEASVPATSPALSGQAGNRARAPATPEPARAVEAPSNGSRRDATRPVAPEPIAPPPSPREPAPANWTTSPPEAEKRTAGTQDAAMGRAAGGPEPPTAWEDEVRPGSGMAEAAAPPLAVADATPASLAAAQAAMPELYRAARGKGAQFGALLVSGCCDVVAVDDVAVTLGFKFPFHAEKARKEIRTLTAVVNEVLGAHYSVNVVEDAGVGEWRSREVASRSPLVRAAQEMGARVLSPNPES